MTAIADIKQFIRDIPGFPKPGIIFKDITTLLREGRAFFDVIDTFAKKYRNEKIDVIVSVESRGFFFGSALAYALGVGVVPVRKKGKLPYKTYAVNYQLEYGSDSLEIHQDAFKKGARVLIIDDLLATGGTIRAVADLVERMGGAIVGIGFLIELTPLKGREKLKGYPVYSLIQDEHC